MNTINCKYNTGLTVYFYLQETHAYAGGNPTTARTAYNSGSGTQDLYVSWSTDSGSINQEYPGYGTGVSSITEFSASSFPGIYEVVLLAPVTNGNFALVNLHCTTTDDKCLTPLYLVTDNLPVTVNADVTKVSGDSTAANNLEAAFDGTGYGIQPALGATSVSANPVDVTSISGDATAANNLESAFDGTGYGIQPAAGATEVLADLKKISGDTAGADNAEKFFDGTGYGIQATDKTTVKAVPTPSVNIQAGKSDSSWWRP